MWTNLLAGFVLMSHLGFGTQGADSSAVALRVRERLLVHQGRMMGILGGWALGSMALGTYQVATGGRFARFMGYQNLAWGAIDGAIALWGVWERKRKESAPSESIDWIRERDRFARLLLINAGLDVLYITAGAVLLFRGKDERWRGTGAGILLQGAFLLLLDGLGYLVLVR